MDSLTYNFNPFGELITIDGIEIDRAERQIAGTEHRAIVMPAFMPNDPIIQQSSNTQQLHLRNPTSETDFRVVDILEDYAGSGVAADVSDSGVQRTHYDFGSHYNKTEHHPVAQPAFIPSDPLFSPDQWHLQNPTSGPDINVVNVWDDYTGAGVVVGVIDSGVQYTHYDLNDNYNHDLDFDALDGDNDPAPPNNQGHGASVAGVIAAEQNGQLGVDVAFDAEVAGFRMGFGAQGSVAQETASFEKQVDVDVSNNSWGYGGFFFDNFDDPSNFGFDDSGAAIKNAVENGRGGLVYWISIA